MHRGLFGVSPVSFSTLEVSRRYEQESLKLVRPSEIALLFVIIIITCDSALCATQEVGISGLPELEGSRPLVMAQSQGLRTDAGSESGKPQTHDRQSEAKLSDRSS